MYVVNDVNLDILLTCSHLKQTSVSCGDNCFCREVLSDNVGTSKASSVTRTSFHNLDMTNSMAELVSVMFNIAKFSLK